MLELPSQCFFPSKSSSCRMQARNEAFRNGLQFAAPVSEHGDLVALDPERGEVRLRRERAVVDRRDLVVREVDRHQLREEPKKGKEESKK